MIRDPLSGLGSKSGVSRGTGSSRETQIKEKREANKKTILDAARKADPKLVRQIVSLYQGGMFQLYQFRVRDLTIERTLHRGAQLVPVV